MIDFHLDSDEKVMDSIIYGKITNEQLADVIEKIVQIKDETGGYRGLSYFCAGVQLSSLSSQTIFLAGKRMGQASFRKDGKSATVTRSNLAYGLSRIFQTILNFSQEDETKVFKVKELEDAFVWLGINEKTKQEICGRIKVCETKGSLE
ncbi:MAG: hypothetical protein R8M14_02585 [Ghiorsea sp.]